MIVRIHVKHAQKRLSPPAGTASTADPDECDHRATLSPTHSGLLGPDTSVWADIFFHLYTTDPQSVKAQRYILLLFSLMVSVGNRQILVLIYGGNYESKRCCIFLHELRSLKYKFAAHFQT